MSKGKTRAEVAAQDALIKELYPVSNDLNALAASLGIGRGWLKKRAGQLGVSRRARRISCGNKSGRFFKPSDATVSSEIALKKQAEVERLDAIIAEKIPSMEKTTGLLPSQIFQKSLGNAGYHAVLLRNRIEEKGSLFGRG